ncbi:Phosphatidylcholine-sterol acyltransferase [Schistosoma japonicum]|nr:Phosphatidylcholine-sterol acyltransferase [Schistosoma japonicum]
MNCRLVYDPKTKRTTERGLCDVEFPGWGDTWASEYISTEKYQVTSYMKRLVDSLTKDKFFIRNKTLRGAPYDFRRAPSYNFGIPFRSPLAFRAIERSFPSMAFLLPDPRVWPANEQLIITPKRNYSAHDMEVFFKDIYFPQGYSMMKESKSIFDPFERPTDVAVYCIYGVHVPTISQMIFTSPGPHRSAFPNQVPLLKYGDGDGIVSLRKMMQITSTFETIIRSSDLLTLDKVALRCRQNVISMSTQVVDSGRIDFHP